MWENTAHMTTKTTNYAVHGAWTNENDSHHEIDGTNTLSTFNAERKNCNSNGRGDRTYETPFMRKYFIHSGLRPDGVAFTNAEIKKIKFFKALVVIESKLTSGPSIFFHCLGYGLDLPTSLLIGGAIFLQHLTFENKTRLYLSKSLDMRESLRSPEKCREIHKEITGNSYPALRI